MLFGQFRDQLDRRQQEIEQKIRTSMPDNDAPWPIGETLSGLVNQQFTRLKHDLDSLERDILATMGSGRQGTGLI